MPTTALERRRGYLASRDDRALWKLLYPDAVFESPIVHTLQRGRETAFKYLAADKVLGGPGFRHVGEWRSDTGAVLEFESELEGIRINGVDIITLSPGGTQITHFKVMIRPLKAINLVHRLMGERLAEG